MNNYTGNAFKEDLLSKYIDSLNDESMLETDEEEIDDELMELFETVKAVKRLKGTEIETTLSKDKETAAKRKRKFHNYMKAAGAVAAAVVIFAASGLFKGNFGMQKKSSSLNNSASNRSAAGAVGNLKSASSQEMLKADNAGTGAAKELEDTEQNNVMSAQDKNTDMGIYSMQANPTEAQSNSASTGIPAASKKGPGLTADASIKSLVPEAAGRSATNVVSTMRVAYQDLKSYKGTIEIRSVAGGKTESAETIKVSYKSPDKYYAESSVGGVKTLQISDGDKIYTIQGNNVDIDYVYPQKYLWKYNIGQEIDELGMASDIREAGQETLFGRETVIYEYRYSGDEKYNRIWVDKKLNLPVRKEIYTAPDRVLVNEFKDISINVDISDSLFNYTVKPGDNVTYENEKAPLNEAEKYCSILPAITANVPDALKLKKVVGLKDDLYKYYLNYQDSLGKDFLDLYVTINPVTDFYVPGDAHGRLLDGWTEMESGAVNVFKAYIGKSNTIKWIGKNYEIVVVSSLDTMQIAKMLEDSANSKIEPISEDALRKMGIEPAITKAGH